MVNGFWESHKEIIKLVKNKLMLLSTTLSTNMLTM